MSGWRNRIVVGLWGLVGFLGMGACWAAADKTPGGQGGEERASQALTAESDLSDYLAHAALHSPGLKAAFLQWKATLEEIPQARALPDPRFNYGYYIREVETRVGPQQHRVGFAQMFPWYGSRKLRGGVAIENAEAARQRYESKKLELFYRLKNIYYELHYLDRESEITQSNRQLLENIERVARAKAEGGAALADAIKVQLELSRLEDHLAGLGDTRQATVAQFNALLSRPSGASVTVIQEIVPSVVELNREELLRSLASHPDLKELDALERRGDKSVRLSRKEGYPNVTVGVDYIQTGDALDTSTPDNGKDPVIAQLSLSIPLWRTKYKARTREAKAKHQLAIAARVEREDHMRSALSVQFFRYRDADRKVSLYHDTLLPQASSAMELERAAYEAGRGEFSDLLEAHRLLLQIELELVRARVDREQRLARIEMMTGRPLSRGVKGGVR